MMKFVTILILLAFISPAYGATIYKWVDEKGVVNFTDDYDNVPSSYRDRVEVKHYLTEGLAPAYTDVPPQKRAEAKTDLYGRDETWWRDKVRPWRKQLKEASENYENANEKFLEKAEAVSQTNFYGRSRSQTKWDVMALGTLNEERKKYEAQVVEAKEMLEKLWKEAEETKADPAWLE